MSAVNDTSQERCAVDYTTLGYFWLLGNSYYVVMNFYRKV